VCVCVYEEEGETSQEAPRMNNNNKE